MRKESIVFVFFVPLLHGAIRSPPSDVFSPGERYPNSTEEAACGTIKDIVRRNSARFVNLIEFNNGTNIDFATSEARYMTSRMRRKMNALALEVERRWPETQLRVMRTWTSQIDPSKPRSLHYEGRATNFVTADGNASRLGILAGMAASVGFDWIYYRPATVNGPGYIHASVIPEVCQAALDLAFILDGSGSVGKNNFRKEIDFVKNVIDFFNIGFNATRVAVFQYSTSVYPAIELKNYFDKTSLKSAVDQINYRGGSTRTHLALTRTYTTTFTVAQGARDSKVGVPKVAVFLTDGKSNGGSIVTPAQRVKDEGINVFSIGVTSNVKVSELNLIASDPDDDHVFLLDSFNDIAGFVDQISAVSCDEPAVVDPGDNTTTEVGEDDFKYFKTECEAFGDEITIEQRDLEGRVHVYASISAKNPSPLDPPSIVVRNESDLPIRTLTIRLPSGSITKLIYVSVQGQNATNRFVLNIWDTLFNRSNYDAHVVENSRPGTFVVNVTADYRSGFNFRYVIIEGNYGNAFQIDHMTGRITTSKALDRESIETYRLSILAQDDRLLCHRGKTQVTVTVKDLNDNRPIFVENNFRLSVAENEAIGTQVGVVSARDRDKGINATIQYEIVNSSSVPFTIDPNTGVVYTNAVFDRETLDVYDFKVVARDGGNLASLLAAVVTVTITDVNDNAPIFNETNYDVDNFDPVQEHYVITVHATDRDIGLNGDVRYEVSMTTKVGDVEWRVRIVARDLGTPSLFSTVESRVTTSYACHAVNFVVDAVTGVVTAGSVCRLVAVVRPTVLIEGRGPANFSCEASNGNANISAYGWTKDGATLVPPILGETFAIATSNRNDDGGYACYVLTDFGRMDSLPEPLTVHYPPGIILHPRNASVQEGNPVTLVCAADGKPVPTISWLKDGFSLPPQSQANLTLPEAFQVDAGEYRCFAENIIGSATSDSAYLFVYADDSLIDIIIEVDNPSSTGLCNAFDSNDFQSAVQDTLETPMFVVDVDLSGGPGSSASLCPLTSCEPNPCKNFGVCRLDVVSSFACQCAPGWQGVTCEEDIDECTQDPCLNGGTCRNERGSFQCSCATGYEGRRCELLIDACTPDPCSDDEACVSFFNGSSQHVCVPSSAVVTVDKIDDDQISEDDISFLINFGSGNRKRRDSDPSCQVRFLNETTNEIKFTIICPDGGDGGGGGDVLLPAVGEQSDYCQRLVQQPLFKSCLTGSGQLSNSQLKPTNVTIRFFLHPERTFVAHSAAYGLSLIDEKSLREVLAEQYGYKVVNVQAVPTEGITEESKGLSSGAAAGVAIAVVAVVVVLVIIVVWRVRSTRGGEDFNTTTTTSASYSNTPKTPMKVPFPTTPDVVIVNDYTQDGKIEEPEPLYQNNEMRKTSQIPFLEEEEENGHVLMNPTYGAEIQKPAPPTLPPQEDDTNTAPQNIYHTEEPLYANADDSPDVEPWFHGSIDRVEAERRLAAFGVEGAFLIRNSSKGDGYSFSIYTPNSAKPVRHLLIQGREGEFTIVLSDGTRADFASLGDIVAHYKEHEVKFPQGRIILTQPCTKSC